MTTATQVVLVGFANSGKTTFFNQLTQSKQTTGNWAGVTVAIKQKQVSLDSTELNVTDLPGVNSLVASTSQSQDVKITRNYLTSHQADLVINLVDVTQLNRQLYLTTQILELGLPTLVVLTKVDRFPVSATDVEQLAQRLGCPVVALDVRQKLKPEAISEFLKSPPKNAFESKKFALPETITAHLQQQNCLLIQFEQNLKQQSCDCEHSQPALQQIMTARHQLVAKWTHGLFDEGKQYPKLSDTLDQWLLHPLLGVPFFLLMMYLLFMLAINIGSAFIDFFDILAGALLVTYPQAWLADFGLPIWMLTIVEGFGTGVQTVATFIPVVVCLFFGLTLLETSGYLARAAFVVDKLMQKIGLPGKAFVPLIVGFGCTVPATMATRVLDSERERITTVMMAPFMSCGARLPVYALFAAAFFPNSGQNIVFLLYLVGIVAAIFTGFLLKATVLPGQSSSRLMELPLYELPRPKYVLKRIAQRTSSFVFGAGKTIVLVVCVLNFFNSLALDGSFGHQDTDKSVLSQTAQIITPALAPIGIKEENWQAGVGIITGIFAKEALVATFNSLYSPSTSETNDTKPLAEVWQQAKNSVAENLLGIKPEDPLGVDVGNIDTIEYAAQEQGVEVSTYTAMQAAFNGQLGAFSYLLFILLYTPCAAAMGAIKNEVGGRWAGFAGLWSFVFAYLVATACYQLGVITSQPVASFSALALVLTCFALIFVWLKYKAKHILTIPTRVTYS